MYTTGHIAFINFMQDDELYISILHELDINELLKSGFCLYSILIETLFSTGVCTDFFELD